MHVCLGAPALRAYRCVCDVAVEKFVCLIGQSKVCLFWSRRAFVGCCVCAVADMLARNLFIASRWTRTPLVQAERVVDELTVNLCSFV